MGVFSQKIRVLNAKDVYKWEDNEISETEIRQMEVDFLIDTGAYMTCINESIKDQLGLRVRDRQEAVLADGSRLLLDIVGPIEISVFNRRTTTEAIVLPGNAQPLFGSIPLEALDLLIDPKEGKLFLPPDRPYIAQTLLL